MRMNVEWWWMKLWMQLWHSWRHAWAHVRRAGQDEYRDSWQMIAVERKRIRRMIKARYAS